MEDPEFSEVARFVRWVIVVGALGAIAIVAMALSAGAGAGAAEPRAAHVTLVPVQNELSTAEAVAPAGPDMARGGVPVMYFGVNSCGVTILWLTMEDGRMFRIDPEHSPKDLKKFMETIKALPHDLVVIPCPDTL